MKKLITFFLVSCIAASTVCDAMKYRSQRPPENQRLFVSAAVEAKIQEVVRLLAMPYLGDVDVNDPIYQNTRRFVWSESNPYFFKGKVAEGIGGPHIGYDMAWPMPIMMKAFTSQDDAEIKWCVETLMKTDAGTGFMHESFHVDDPDNFTREWFAWQNGLFGELILKIIGDGKLELLNNIDLK